jgi:hypothetical protein
MYIASASSSTSLCRLVGQIRLAKNPVASKQSVMVTFEGPSAPSVTASAPFAVLGTPCLGGETSVTGRVYIMHTSPGPPVCRTVKLLLELNVWSVMFQIYCRGRTVATHCGRRMWKKNSLAAQVEASDSVENMNNDDEVDAHGTRHLQHVWWWQPSLPLAGLTRTGLAALSLSCQISQV